MSGYAKLFTRILDSTIWREDDPTRILWITMLALADRDGNVFCTIPGLADRARITLIECERALERFQQPDKYSWSQEEQGRRIKTIEGGWFLINHAKFRSLMSTEENREKTRLRVQKHRERKQKSLHSVTDVTSNASNDIAEATTKAKEHTPPTPLSGGLTNRQVRSITTEMQRIAAAMVGADYSVEDALRRACGKVGVEFETARYLLGES